MIANKLCEYCGKPFELRDSYEAKHQKYCSNECRQLAHRKRITLICETCGDDFEVQRAQSKRRFCSPHCRSKGLIDPNKRSVFTCQWCGKEFEDWTYRQPQYCSDQCRSEYGAQCPRPGARKPEAWIVLICAFCGKEYRTKEAQKRLRGSSYCSNECKHAQMSIDRRGENNPHWTGGTLPATAYGPNWGRQQRKARKRDKHTCQICGYQIGGKRYLDVHHIRPLKEFDGDTEQANQLTNLICLCRPCHAKVGCGQLMVGSDNSY